MSIKKLVETIKHNGILASAGELKKLFTKEVEAEEKNIELEKKLTDMAVQLANAESKCRDLAGLVAENAVMKEFLHSRVDESICDKHVKTPATDAFLAEVRASARNDFIGRIEWIIRNECNPDKTEAIINELQNFSEELKSEAAQ
ncbi:hypothetical protein [Citrobacter werkmanii]|uniref:hypothetical protein n=1 Tax=Citrobacter werkmanii TaxID=67827 RepID=UPI003F8D8E9F